MNNNENAGTLTACAEYFLERSGYDRVFKALRRKWKQYGRVAGIIKIEHPSQKERQVLERFFAKDFPEGAIRFSAAEFECALQQTRFRGIVLEELLKEYFQEELLTNKEEKKQEIRKKERFFETLCGAIVETYGEKCSSLVWLRKMANEKKYGYRMIVAEYGKEPETVYGQVEHVCQAIELLDRKKGIRLAVLGTEVTKNPHEFDRNTFSGKLLIQGLSCIKNNMACKSAEEVLMLYYASGIKPDDISSFTTVYGIRFYTDTGVHPAYEGFIEMSEPFVVTLSNLGKIRKAEAKGEIVYVIENQMVFSHLCEKLGGQEVSMVCTSGQLKTASWILLDMLCEARCRLFYCGDLDPEGIDIAEKVLVRNGGNAQLWHMSKADYDLSVSDEDVSAESLRKLERVKHPDLLEVKRAVLEKKKAGYQERLVEILQEEMCIDFIA